MDRKERKEEEEGRGEADAAAGLQKPPKDREPRASTQRQPTQEGQPTEAPNSARKGKRKGKPKDETEKTGRRKEQERRKGHP